MDNVLQRIGVRRVINAVGPATRLGGIAPDIEVVEAMRSAVSYPVRIDELMSASGHHLARLLGVPAVYITAGAAAGLALGTAVAIARGDSGLADSLPRTEAPHGILIQAAHRDPYDRAVEVGGGRLVAVGYPEGTHLGELERSLTDDVVAVLHRPGRPGNGASLREVARVAHERGKLVLVDAAVHVPPADRLAALLDDGADLVAMSGGKAFGGPQASGLLCGAPELVSLVGRFHQDMDERATTWPLPSGDATPPRHGVGRIAKVGREQVAGLVVAVERYLEGRSTWLDRGRAELDIAEETLVRAGVPVRRERLHSLDVDILEVTAPGDPDVFIHRLRDRAVPVFVGESEVWRGVLTLNPMGLLAGDGRMLAEAIVEVRG